VNILLDTNVISELYRANPDDRVRSMVARQQPDTVFLSVITAGELRNGVFLLPVGSRRAGLEKWIHEGEQHYADRLLPVDLETCHIWGEIAARARSQGIQIPATDGLIAATAIRHGLHVMTRNVKDFEPTGALIINPWE
jgi:toxin FitB